MDRGHYSLKTVRSIDNLKIGFGIFVPETVRSSGTDFAFLSTS